MPAVLLQTSAAISGILNAPSLMKALKPKEIHLILVG